MITIILRDSKFSALTHFGTSRNNFNIFEGHQLEDHRKDLGFDSHIKGCLSEGALCEFLNIEYNPNVGIHDTTTGDVARIYQVKSIDIPGRDLKIRPHDPLDFFYVLALIHPRNLRRVDLIGFIHGSDGKTTDYHHKATHNTNEGYWIPQSKLLPMEKLLATAAGKP